MAAGGEKSADFYAVLGMKKECTSADLRNAYKRLALKWHPDRCSASESSKHVEEAKKKFQAIQQAYSVLSDANKRFLYDVGVYDSDDDDDENGMGDFLDEMATMMNKSNENGGNSFGELQELFEEMFQSDLDAFASSSRSATTLSCSSSSFASCSETWNSNNKRNSSDMTPGAIKAEATQFEGFCTGAEEQEHQENIRMRRGGDGAGMQGRIGSRTRRDGRKQKVSFGHDVSSGDYSSTSISSSR